MKSINELNYRCCFCNQSIASSKVNPAEINILINFDKTDDQQYNQTFFCHTLCFKEKLDNALKMHFHLHNILRD